MERVRAAKFPNVAFRTVDQVADWLDENYPSKCIGRAESEEDARWYAAQHDLASRLSATIRSGD